MNATTTILILISAYCVCSMAYVYAIRGNDRFESFKQYMRKGWPIFNPFNCWLYIFTKGASARFDITGSKEFEALTQITDNLDVIREEALALLEQDIYASVGKEGAISHNDVGFRTFHKYGWRKFYINWYGYQHPSAARLCPKTQSVLAEIPQVNGAMFTILPPGGKLTRHTDPLACSLRYHLGISTPNSSDCFISVDGEHLVWEDGKAFIFDETLVHYVKNNTNQSRLILMCDVERPMYFPGRIFNSVYKLFTRMTVVANTEEDRVGAINRLFASVQPIMGWGKRLKKKNRPLYKTLSFILNIALLILLASVLYLLLSFFARLF